jgi:cell division protein FtsI (penicillin-binding protein 3)
MKAGEEKLHQLAQVPFLKGLTKQQAQILLTNLNLPFDIKGKSGYVVSQTPEAETDLPAGQEISLTLSETYANDDSATVREGYAEIPDLKGMNMRQVTTLLAERGLETKIIGSGTVFAQFPKAGQWLRKGHHVTVRGRAKSLEILTQTSKR